MQFLLSHDVVFYLVNDIQFSKLGLIIVALTIYLQCLL